MSKLPLLHVIYTKKGEVCPEYIKSKCLHVFGITRAEQDYILRAVPYSPVLVSVENKKSC